ncbi:MAG TPA: LysR family transcriptional regulator [bacterium]|nr:LysR family transcriptional regulator [bacterium]HPN29745.1 LysR family transcriptional regulator [bacterium]
MKIKISFKILDDSGMQFLGNGIIWLLEKIDECGSISGASKDMNMSYSKALKIIKNLEKNINEDIIKRKKGGFERGGAKLTGRAKSIVKNYNLLRNKIEKYAEIQCKTKLKSILCEDEIINSGTGKIRKNHADSKNNKSE